VLCTAVSFLLPRLHRDSDLGIGTAVLTTNAGSLLARSFQAATSDVKCTPAVLKTPVSDILMLTKKPNSKVSPCAYILLAVSPQAVVDFCQGEEAVDVCSSSSSSSTSDDDDLLGDKNDKGDCDEGDFGKGEAGKDGEGEAEKDGEGEAEKDDEGEDGTDKGEEDDDDDDEDGFEILHQEMDQGENEEDEEAGEAQHEKVDVPSRPQRKRTATYQAAASKLEKEEKKTKKQRK